MWVVDAAAATWKKTEKKRYTQVIGRRKFIFYFKNHSKNYYSEPLVKIIDTIFPIEINYSSHHAILIMNLKSLHAAFYAFKLAIENKIFKKIVKINLVSIFLCVAFCPHMDAIFPES